MDVLNPKDLKNLAKEHSEICISLIMPADIIAGGNLSNRTRFRNLIEITKRKLETTNLNRDKIGKLLSPATDYLNDDTVWQDQFTSLLVYISNEEAYLYKLPIAVREETYISHYFNILPILDCLSLNVCYYLLFVDEGGAKFFEGDRYNLRDITTKAIKNINIENLMGNYDVEEEQFFHVETGGGRNKNHEGVIYHGHGNAKDDKKLRAAQLFEIIEKEVTSILSKKKLPLVLAGHEHLVSIYKEVNRYKNTLIPFVKLKSDQPNNKELHEGATKLTETIAINNLMELKRKYCDLTGTGLATNEIEEIAKAAKAGKISDLFVEKDNFIFGSIIIENSDIDIKVTNDDLDENISNTLSVWALNQKAEIHLASEIYIPEKGISAILRY